jgi:hypothetical protein
MIDSESQDWRVWLAGVATKIGALISKTAADSIDDVNPRGFSRAWQRINTGFTAIVPLNDRSKIRFTGERCRDGAFFQVAYNLREECFQDLHVMMLSFARLMHLFALEYVHKRMRMTSTWIALNLSRQTFLADALRHLFVDKCRVAGRPIRRCVSSC